MIIIEHFVLAKRESIEKGRVRFWSKTVMPNSVSISNSVLFTVLLFIDYLYNIIILLSYKAITHIQSDYV